MSAAVSASTPLGFAALATILAVGPLLALAAPRRPDLQPREPA
ncbi:hypothetical protein [Streptomyces sp. Isolate_219]|nr:hypothetical protein [Streptomyces sp. Isolate_219]